MFDWLNVLKIRLGITVFYFHHWLSVLGYFSLLAAILLTGFEIDSIWLRLSPLIAPSSFVLNKSHAPTEVLVCHATRQELGARKNFHQAQGSPSLTPNQKLDPLVRGDNPLIAGHSPSLSLSVPSRLPEKLGNLDIEDRKKLFIDLLLPTVMVALDEVKQERQQLLTIIAELGGLSPDLSFDENIPGWQQQIGADNSKFILGLTRKYRTENADELVAMVNVLPPSLIIAQGAIESAWGASRHANKVNNLFGMYSNVDSGHTSSRDEGKAPKIMEYESILDSVRSYILNINRLSSYKKLRRIRSQTLDPMLIADGLTLYSERKEFYIADVKHIITHNNLQDFDTLIITTV